MFGWYALNGILCIAGVFYGYVKKSEPILSEIGKVKRPIHLQPLHMNILIVAPVLGLLQFASMYAEFNYLFNSIFKHQIYAMFGFLFVNLVLQIAVIALLSVL